MDVTKTLKCGKTRRKLEELTLSSSFKRDTEKNLYVITFSVNGAFHFERSVEEIELFDAIKIGYAGLRQALRHFKKENPSVKFFEDIEGELLEQTVEDIFWTHDCITDEMQSMIDWAKEKGYQPEKL